MSAILLLNELRPRLTEEERELMSAVDLERDQSVETAGAVDAGLEIDVSLLWRSFVTCRDNLPERTLFVEAVTRTQAHERIRAVLAAVEPCSSDAALDESYYNLSSSSELIENGISEQRLQRLFETGWAGDKVAHWVTHPIIIARDPAPLLRAWAALPQPEVAR